MPNRFLVLLLGASLSAVVVGCGDDGTTSDSASSAASTPPAASTPVGGGTDSSADASTPSGSVVAEGAITIKAAEMSFTPSKITAKAGKLKITLDNTGTMEHELVVLKTDAAPGSLPVSDNQVSEDDSVGEVADVEAGESKSHTFDLEPGHYVLVCNVPGHYAAGMRGELTVE